VVVPVVPLVVVPVAPLVLEVAPMGVLAVVPMVTDVEADVVVDDIVATTPVVVTLAPWPVVPVVPAVVAGQVAPAWQTPLQQVWPPLQSELCMHEKSSFGPGDTSWQPVRAMRAKADGRRTIV
jgi:hypothetical protein